MKLLDGAKKLKIITEKGTDLVMDIEGQNPISSSGNFTKPGTGGNMPAGEVYIAPIEDKTEGKVVIDASSRNRHKTELIRDPITINIKKGKISSITGGVEAGLLKESFEWAAAKAKYPERVSKICELGIGMNKSAKVIGTTIIDEKAYGTAHVAFGSNYWFGGTIKSIIHLDQVFRNPEIYADGKRIPL